jgi:hypothetical protein
MAVTIIPPHTAWLTHYEKTLKTKNGRPVQIVEFNHQQDKKILSAWAKHFRENYCLDSAIDRLRAGTGLSRAQYLKQFVFPNQTGAGPGVRSGDFAEILVSDYFEFTHAYTIPRTRYRYKGTPNESTKGSDLLAFKMNPVTAGSTQNHSPNDILMCVEVKAQFTGKYDDERLQSAINDSRKDELRKSISLNAMKQRLLAEQNVPHAQIVERFQNASDRPYKSASAAAAFYCQSVFAEKTVSIATTKDHPQAKSIQLLVFRGKDMMKLVHQIYGTASDEA